MTAPVIPAQTVTEALDSASTDAVAAFAQEHGGATPPVVDPSPAPDKAIKPPVVPSDKKAPKDPTEADEEQDGTTDEDPALPDGYVAVAPVTEGLVAEFVVRDAEGELEVPDLTIEYKANGRIRKDRLDQVVKMAQLGSFNLEREQKLVAQEQRVQAEATQLKGQLDVREHQLEAILSDPDLYEAARERYMQANAPEQKVARLQQQLRDKDLQQARQSQQAQGQAFISQEVMPALQVIAEACPEVTQEELARELSLAMVSVMENGSVPPAKYPLIRQYIVNQLTDWAEDTHARRFARLSAASQTATEKVQTVQAESQRIKRQVARATKPMGRGGAPASGATPRGTAPQSVSDAVDDAMSDVMAGLGRSG
jgi:hypothetical protein